MPEKTLPAQYGWHQVNGRLVFGVRNVALHVHIDLDAIYAYFLARLHPQAFPGIETATIEFWPQGPPPDGRSAKDHEAEGTLMLDVGGEEATFDHHPSGKCFSQCTSDQVAEFTGIANNRIFLRGLQYVRMHDLEGPLAHSLEIRKLANEFGPRVYNIVGRVEGLSISDEQMQAIAKAMNAAFQPELAEFGRRASLLQAFSLANLVGVRRRLVEDDAALLEKVYQELCVIHERERFFWTTIRQEFLTKAQIAQIFDGERSYRVAVITSPYRDVGGLSRTDEGCFCSVCIQRNPRTGHTFISGLSPEQDLELAKILRVLEMQNRGAEPFLYTAKQLTESLMEECPQWYIPKDLHGDAFIVMNGGDKATAVEPSILSLTEIFQAVCVVLDERILATECPHSSCLTFDCSMFRFNLTRCQQILQNSIGIREELIASI